MPTRSPGRGSQVWARVIGVLFLVVGAVCLVTGGRDFAYAARLAGTQGTFQVLFAERVPGNGRGGSDTVWYGTFRSADGKITDPDARLQDEADGHRLGARIPVTRADAHTYYTARPNYALAWLALCLAGGCLAAVMIPAVCFGRAVRGADHWPRWAWTGLRILWGCAIASGAAALVAVVVT